MSESLAKDLAHEFKDGEYAHEYMESHTCSRIAGQVHALRKQRGWSQSDLANRAGMSQERVSKVENGDFSSLTLKTLWKFSRAFDVHLHVAFTNFVTGIKDVTNLSLKALEVETRNESIKRADDHSWRQDKDDNWQLLEKLAPVTTLPPKSTIGPDDLDQGEWIEATTQTNELAAL